MKSTGIFKVRSFRAKVTAVLAGLAIAFGGMSSALAVPILYAFTTAANPFGAAGGAIDYFLNSSFVAGTFLYDASAPATGVSGTGATTYSSYDTGGGVFSSSFKGLAGTAQGLVFTDARGRTEVGNDIPTDIVGLTAEPTLRTNLTGFNIGTFKLVNVRMFWLEGQLGITDFLNNQSLPAVLPAFQGRLALDFVPLPDANAPTVNFNHSVFFDGLRVATVPAAVPEPASVALLVLGFGVLALSRRSTQVN